MSAQLLFETDWEMDAYTDDEYLTDTSSIGEQKKICRRGKREKQREKTPVIERIRRRLRAIKQVIKDELTMLGIIARIDGNFELSKALNSKIEVWSDLHARMEDEAQRTLPCCVKGNNDAARWKSAGTVMVKIVDDIFNFFREICDTLPRKRRARTASSLVFRLVSSTYDTENQGTKSVYNQTLVDNVPNFTLDHVLEKFPELIPLHAQIIESWKGDHNGSSPSPKKRLNHFRRVMESLSALTSVTAVPSPTLHKQPIVPFGLTGTGNTILSSQRVPRRNSMECYANAGLAGMSSMSAVPSRRSYSHSQQTKHLYFRPQQQPQPPQFHWPAQPTVQSCERTWRPQLPHPPVLNTFNPSFSTQANKKSKSTIGFPNGQTVRNNTIMKNPWMCTQLRGPSPFFE